MRPLNFFTLIQKIKKKGDKMSFSRFKFTEVEVKSHQEVDILPAWFVCKVCGANYLALAELVECPTCTQDSHTKLCLSCERRFPRNWVRKEDILHPYCPNCEEARRHNTRDEPAYSIFERD